MVMTEWGVPRVASPGAELRKWRERRGLALRALGSRVNFDFSHIGRVERGEANLTLELAEACDRALDAGGAVIHAYHAARGSVRPAQLPAVPAQLVGRDTELAKLLQGLAHRAPGTARVVAVDGPAGVGKTALAVRLAHQIAGEHVDGHLYADLGAFGPPENAMVAAQVLKGFLSAMGASVMPETAAERAALYRSMLAERRVLIVLDNVGDVDDLAELVPASPGCTVVVTSRRALSSLVSRVSATRVTLRPLSERDSIRVLTYIIGETRAEADADAVATLARLCGHLPLALCAAADEIAMYPDRRVVDVVDELLDAEHRLSAWELVDLRAVLSWSYRTLEGEAARLFRLLGLHSGPHLSVPAVAALAGTTLPRTRRLLHRLAWLHLVDIDISADSREAIRLDTLIHAYASELVTREEDENQRTAAIQRLVTWYAAAVRGASLQLTPHVLTPLPPDGSVRGVEPLVFADEVAAWSWCTSELDNVEPITALALNYGPQSAAHHLFTGLTDLGLVDLALTRRDTDQQCRHDHVRPTATASRRSGVAAGAPSRRSLVMAARHGETEGADSEEPVEDAAGAPSDGVSMADRPRAGGWLGHGLPWGNVWGTCSVTDLQHRHRLPHQQQVVNGTKLEWAAWAFWTGCPTDSTDSRDAARGWQHPWPSADDHQATRASHVPTEAQPGSRSVA